jgi:hypothetical protein
MLLVGTTANAALSWTSSWKTRHLITETGLTRRVQLVQPAETAYPSGAPEFTPVFSGICVNQYLVLYVCFVDRCLSFCPFPFGHCARRVKPGPWVLIAVGWANIQIVHYFDHGYLEEENWMIHSFTVAFGAKYLTGMVTSVPPYETFILIKNNILHTLVTMPVKYFAPKATVKLCIIEFSSSR